MFRYAVNLTQLRNNSFNVSFFPDHVKYALCYMGEYMLYTSYIRHIHIVYNKDVTCWPTDKTQIQHVTVS